MFSPIVLQVVLDSCRCGLSSYSPTQHVCCEAMRLCDFWAKEPKHGDGGQKPQATIFASYLREPGVQNGCDEAKLH